MDSTPLWTVGHGLLSAEAFISLLKSARIGAVADVRTVPYSSRAPHFDTGALQKALGSSDISYRYFGGELGGRPRGDEFYDPQGHVFYRRVAASQPFVDALQLLLRGASQKRTAILCSESNPDACHRTLLVGRAARLAGASVTHLLHNGAQRPFDDQLVTQAGLPGMEEDPWRSIVQVRREPLQSSSLSG